ncbi:hypothetical protein G6F54_014139 [Rhizopus delemar]|nr:hypothetical protein G6F54_014139 [Rhizopus delemar]
MAGAAAQHRRHARLAIGIRQRNRQQPATAALDARGQQRRSRTPPGRELSTARHPRHASPHRPSPLPH